MKFAVIPWVESLMEDQLFNTNDCVKNPDNRFTPYLDMKMEFEHRGDEFHTIDIYNDLAEIDWFLFFEQNNVWLERIIKVGKADKMIYCNAEPPAVYSWNCPKGYEKLKRFYPFIMTWNDEWVDNSTVFKRNIPYYFTDNRKDTVWKKRKLLTFISGNKHSNDINELYSERERVISYFEKKENSEFDFYGTGWKKTEHPSYRGEIVSKAEIYQKYKFAICFENSKNLCGYITEKILDCFTSGIVPIYAGAPNINDYIPSSAFINYFEFDSLDSLDSFINGITEEQYCEYLNSADLFLNSDAVNIFSGRKYAEYVYKMINHSKNFKIRRYDFLKLQLKNRTDKVKAGIKSIIKNCVRKKYSGKTIT